MLKYLIFIKLRVYSYFVNLNYNIFNGGKTLNTINISNNNQKKSLIEHKKNIAETILLTTKVYYGVKKTRILKEAYEIALKNNQNIMEKEKIKFENGVATKESYLNAQSSYYNIKAELETLNNNIYSLENQYYNYTGATISKILPDIDLSDITIPSTMQEAIERAKVNSFDVQIAKIDLENSGPISPVSLKCMKLIASLLENLSKIEMV